MTTPEARPAAPILDAHGAPMIADAVYIQSIHRADADFMQRLGWRVELVGDLWRREAARDVQAHGEPIKAGRGFPRWGGTGKRRPAPAWAEYRAFIAESIERRRPAMRATRAELDALNGNGPKPYRCEVCEEHGIDECPAPPPTRLEPEPSSMARTALALGFAFTSDDARG